jgi:hypothetical protein
LSQQDIIRQSTKAGLPIILEKLRSVTGRITNVDPLSDKVLDRIYSRPERDEAGLERFRRAQSKGGRD